ncbi:MAG: TA system VapC family ribonuclease toxin, partial [Acidobacteriota bacterium]
MSALLDVNFLVALAWPNHIHHQAATIWFEENHRRGWATCPLTQSGFVRVSSNRKVIPDARTPTEAIILLRELTALEGHEFWIDDVVMASPDHVDPRRIVGHRQVTDAHMVALVLR